MKTKQEIIDEVQDAFEGFEELDFSDYVEGCKTLTDEEKEWAMDNLGVSLIVEHITDVEPEEYNENI